MWEICVGRRALDKMRPCVSIYHEITLPIWSVLPQPLCTFPSYQLRDHRTKRWLSLGLCTRISFYSTAKSLEMENRSLILSGGPEKYSPSATMKTKDSMERGETLSSLISFLVDYCFSSCSILLWFNKMMSSQRAQNFVCCYDFIWLAFSSFIVVCENI